MVTFIDIKHYLENENYLNLLDKIVGTLNIEISEDALAAQDFNIEANMVNKSGVRLEQLDEIYADEEEIVRFSKLYREWALEEEDNPEDNVEYLPPTKLFLIQYLIEYYLLKYDQKQLERYLKAWRVPNYKKHMAELKAIYDQI